MRCSHLDLSGTGFLLHQVNPSRTAVRATTTVVGMRRCFQSRSLLQKQRNHGAGQFLALVFPFDEFAARQGHRLIGWNHLVEDGMKNLAEPFTSLLPIRQR
jgi:hypothetical protein